MRNAVAVIVLVLFGGLFTLTFLGHMQVRYHMYDESSKAAAHYWASAFRNGGEPGIRRARINQAQADWFEEVLGQNLTMGMRRFPATFDHPLGGPMEPVLFDSAMRTGLAFDIAAPHTRMRIEPNRVWVCTSDGDWRLVWSRASKNVPN